MKGKKIPHIAVVGAGAMGSIYACMFAEAGCSTSVVDIWREHIDRIREFGLRIEGASGNRIIKNIFATTEISELDVADLYVIATKADGVSIAARGIARVMDPSSLVLTIQNGLGADERISKYMPINNVLLGVAEGFGASMKGPGHVHHNAMRQIRIGEMSGGKTRRLEWVESIWQKAGFSAKAFSDIHQLVWEKFICNVLCSAPATVFECNIGELFKDPGRREVALGCMMEAYKIGCAKGINFSFDDAIDYCTRFVATMPNANPSMRLDHLAGRRSEIDAINGMVPILGRELGIETPYNNAMVAAIRAREEKF